MTSAPPSGAQNGQPLDPRHQDVGHDEVQRVVLDEKLYQAQTPLVASQISVTGLASASRRAPDCRDRRRQLRSSKPVRR